MKIYLQDYAREFESWQEALLPFVERATEARLRALLDELKDRLDRKKNFPWFSRKPVRTTMANAYDGRAKVAEPVVLSWKFESLLEAPVGQGDKYRTISKLITHIQVLSQEPVEDVALHLHFDLKNAGQLGPHSHMQISERFLASLGKKKLAVPRFPSAVAASYRLHGPGHGRVLSPSVAAGIGWREGIREDPIQPGEAHTLR